MAAALGLVLQTCRISERCLLPRASRLKYYHNIFFQQNYGLAKLRLMNSESEPDVQIPNGKVRYFISQRAQSTKIDHWKAIDIVNIIDFNRLNHRMQGLF